MSITDKSAEIAWLHSSEGRAAIQIEGWATGPRPGAISFFAPDFALAAPQPWLLGSEIEARLKPEPLPELVHRAEPSSAGFANLHEEILMRIHAGEFQKVVPIVCEELEFSRPLSAGMFTHALAIVDGKYSYGFQSGEEGMCGVTPEVLFAVRDGVLTTMALAGTGAVEGPSLLADAKEMREHSLVIEHICGELQRFGTAEAGETIERRYGSLKHLYTPLAVRLNEAPSFLDLVVRLHPTAALGGWPRRPAVEWLERQEFHVGRKRFGAPFGYCRDQEMLCVVAIRGIQWWGTRALLSAGCGVVEGSQSLREWNELQLKRRAIVESLGVSL